MVERNISLLSLDGGGVRSLSSLYILKHIMESIDGENTPRPCDYFNLIGGSGSGGLIAIMLGRLKMDIDQCINAYRRLLKFIFARKRHIPLTSNLCRQSRYDGRRVESAMKAILHELGYEDDVLLRDVDLSCRVFACVTDDGSKRNSAPLTSYPSKYCSNELFKTAKVWQAGQASLSTPPLFDSVPIGPSGRRFYNSITEANNPVREVWIEARGIWPSGSLDSQIQCLVSIGTGVPSIKRLNKTMFGLIKTTRKDYVDTERDMNKFIREHTELDDASRLFRFDVPNGLAEIGLDGVDELDTIVDATEDYLAKELVYKQIQRCGIALGGFR
ncbi:uncharacterized protein BO97DRAFT_344851 [Aspergillus homomorphus CBS 101889]|uniref:FabD/lysophospholipase-like protein n=1 Tax=Aspergillus homomorphus (strain CBS 101889) TaxID=1450537 RepID=A0A395HXA4_ASPHC|nr:FabD/lysophospholipase-like protein [Aspergillus homomorphus CBS 101889]RAL12541.1 FabD/lysophospholipase-like protein [Aspergillus homomorphus CBS 101889]